MGSKSVGVTSVLMFSSLIFPSLFPVCARRLYPIH